MFSKDTSHRVRNKEIISWVLKCTPRKSDQAFCCWLYKQVKNESNVFVFSLPLLRQLVLPSVHCQNSLCSSKSPIHLLNPTPDVQLFSPLIPGLSSHCSCLLCFRLTCWYPRTPLPISWYLYLLSKHLSECSKAVNVFLMKDQGHRW